MAEKKKYHTKQMALLFEYLETTNGEHITVKDICADFEKKGICVGTTTVYRNLEKLVLDGIVLKYNSVGNNGSCYEFVGQIKDKKDVNCLHLICESCGDVAHLKSDELVKIDNHILEECGFKMNALNTAFYGTCKECKGVYK